MGSYGRTSTPAQVYAACLAADQSSASREWEKSWAAGGLRLAGRRDGTRGEESATACTKQGDEEGAGGGRAARAGGAGQAGATVREFIVYGGKEKIEIPDVVAVPAALERCEQMWRLPRVEKLRGAADPIPSSPILAPFRPMPIPSHPTASHPNPPRPHSTPAHPAPPHLPPYPIPLHLHPSPLKTDPLPREARCPSCLKTQNKNSC